MKKRTLVQAGEEKEAMNLSRTYQQRQPMVSSKEANKKDLLLRHPNFVSNRQSLSFRLPPLACEASALTTELIARDHIFGAGDGIRTHDVLLGKQALYR